VPGLRTLSRIAITTLLLAIAMIVGLYSLWQGEVEAHRGTQMELRSASAALAAERKQRAILDREAGQKIADDAKNDQQTAELKDAIDEAAKQVPPGAVTDPAARTVSCSRLQRSGQTGSAKYRDLCGG